MNINIAGELSKILKILPDTLNSVFGEHAFAVTVALLGVWALGYLIGKVKGK